MKDKSIMVRLNLYNSYASVRVMKYINFKKNEQIAFMRLVKKQSNLSWNSIANSLNLTRGMVFHYLSAKSKIPLTNYLNLCSIAKIKSKKQPLLEIKNKTEAIKKVSEKNEKLAELLGALAGDGHLSHINYEIAITCDLIKDNDYITNYIAPLFRNLFNVNSKIKEHHYNNSIKCVINSKKLQEFLVKSFGIPIGKKKGNLHIPDKVFSDKNLLKNYLRGLFDTDGSVYLKRKNSLVVSIISRDKNHLNEVKEGFIKLGYKPSISGKNLYIYDQNQVRIFFNEIGSSNKKHLNRYDNFIKQE
ncbi:MAG: LAGLIDADG family homing endonuclease [Candidatus Woesearchaeota archaeon]